MLNNPDFYPTPKALFDRLIGYSTRLDGKILEPSAGKGDMIEYIKARMGRRDYYDIDAIENDPDLVNTLRGAGYNVVWDDFLTYETFKEYDYIIMNPPFSADADHLSKALDIAENQLTDCQIYAIINKETLTNPYSNKRKELKRRLERWDAEIEYVSSAFAGSDSQRKTNVEVAIIRVHITQDFGGKTLYQSLVIHATNDGEALNETETALSTHLEASELSEKMNDIERLVVEYERACELIKEAFEAQMKKASFLSYISEVNKREGDVTGPFNYVDQSDYTGESLKAEIDRLRREYWALILDTDDFRKHLTSDGRERLQRQLSAANAMEINFANIKTLLMAMYSNKDDMLIESIVRMFERITTYHMNEYSTNIHYYNGWKTNDAYRINEKIIIPINRGGFESWDFGREWSSLRYTRLGDFVGDLIKAFQLIDPTVEDDFEFIGDNSYENNTLRFRMFLNGNIHIWFKRKDLLDKLNYIAGQYFAWIPSKGEQASDEGAREFAAELRAKEFGEIDGAELLAGE